MSQKKPQPIPQSRSCAQAGCKTRLSRYNTGSLCYACLDNLATRRREAIIGRAESGPSVEGMTLAESERAWRRDKSYLKRIGLGVES